MGEPIRILGIDTATWTASVAVVSGPTVLAERSLVASPSHGFSLIPLIEDVLAAANLHVDDLDGVAVSIGPGSFTGLRIGLSTAKGLAFAHGLDVAGVPTRYALALAAEVCDGMVCPLLDARKGEVYTALYQASGGTLRSLVPECAVVLADWLPRISGPCTFLGDGVGLLAALNGNASRWRALPFDRFHPRGSIVARLGAERIARGDADDLARLEPQYVRPSEAELKTSV